MNYILPPLPYEYNALEPYIDAQTMKIHHTKHHQTYIDNANTALMETKFLNIPIEELITKLDELPKEKKNILRNNLGGHLNHSIFWNGLKKETTLQGNLEYTIKKNFISIENFKKAFENIAMARFGSGWTWLVKKNNQLNIVSTANQDNPLMGEEISGACGFPIFGLDVWEHAYYLKYYNRRLDYIKAFWSIINWNKAEERFLMQI